MQTLTVREIAERIRRYSEDTTSVVDRLRGWTDAGLLEVVKDSDQNPGTGRPRLYPEIAVVDAAILTAFAEAGLSVMRYGRLEGLLKLGRQAAQRAKERRGMAQWLIVWGRPPVGADQLTYEVELQEAKVGRPIKLNKEAHWFHLINVSNQLKSLLTRGSD
jgi:hypothetical protein